MARKLTLTLTALCLALIWAWGGLVAAPEAQAQGVQYSQGASRQDLLRRSQDLNTRARRDTRAATERMRRILQEKRQGQRGLSDDFMDRQWGGNSRSRRQ